MPQHHAKRKHRRARKPKYNVKFKQYISENTEIEKSNHRDVALLEHGWAPEETKFGEPFKGKNRILIS